jgi:hypothetical protein
MTTVVSRLKEYRKHITLGIIVIMSILLILVIMDNAEEKQSISYIGTIIVLLGLLSYSAILVYDILSKKKPTMEEKADLSLTEEEISIWNDDTPGVTEELRCCEEGEGEEGGVTPIKKR